MEEYLKTNIMACTLDKDLNLYDTGLDGRKPRLCYMRTSKAQLSCHTFQNVYNKGTDAHELHLLHAKFQYYG